VGFFFPYYCAGWGTVWHLQRFLQCKTVSYMNSPPLLFSFISPLLQFLESFQQVSFCIYIHVYTFFVPYSLSYPLSLPPAPPTGANSPLPRQNLFCPPVLWFCRKKEKRTKEKKWQFCLFEIKIAMIHRWHAGIFTCSGFLGPLWDWNFSFS
jgi:hypothetical protein